MIILPSTNEDIVSVLGHSIKYNARAITVWDGGKRMAVGGVYYANVPVMFCKIEDELRKHPVTIVRAARIVSGFAPMRCYAFCEEHIKQAARFLEFLGFSKIEGDLWLRQLH